MSYTRAPITEAILDVRVQPRTDLNLDDLGTLSDEISSRYQPSQERLQFSAKFDLSSDKPTEIERRKLGFRYSGAAKDRIFHAQIAGWSFNKLAPYENWEAFRNEAEELWKRYVAAARPEARTQVRLRYVNRLDLPAMPNALQHYLRTVPSISPELPQQVAGYFMQLQIPYEEISAVLVLNQAIVPPPSSEFVSIILDLDLVRTENIPQDDASMWVLLDEMRQKKNDAFEACITNATRELFR